MAKQIAPALENSALYEQIVQDRQEKAAAVENLRQAYAYLDSIMLNLPADCDIWSSLSTMNRGRTVWANPGNGGAKFTLLIMDGLGECEASGRKGSHPWCVRHHH